MDLTVNDFFCGCGGMGLGFQQAGFRVGGAYDFNRWAVESYGNNVSPKVRRLDIAQMVGQDLPYADVWTFGFPCQDISTAGKQLGMVKGETRSGLFYEVMRLLEETENYNSAKLPKVILAENVKNVKQYLPEIESEFGKRGYTMYYKLYNSKYWGVPQNRERYFMVGIRNELQPQNFSFPEQDTDSGNIPTLQSIMEQKVDESYFIPNDKALQILSKEIRSNRIVGWVDRKDRIFAYRGDRKRSTAQEHVYLKPENTVTDALTVAHSVKIIVGDRIRKLTPRECARLQGFPETYSFQVSAAQIYKQFGNAVTVPVAHANAKSIKDFLVGIYG
jgi:DNA (cytosine-5)-methyltransferase 1